VNDLSNWINSLSTNLGVNVSSNLVESGTNSYALVINGTQTGVANAVSFSGLDGANVTSVNGTTSTSSNVSYSNTSSVTNVSLSSNPIVLSSPSSSNNFTISLPNITSGVANILDGSGDVVNTLNLGSLNAGSNTINWDGKDSHGNDVSSGNYSLIVTSITNAHPVSVNTNASDAVLSINGLQVQRPTNTINDVVKGLTINLLSTGASNSEITVGQGADNTSTYVQNFVSAFNDVVAQHTSMVANPINSTSTTPSGSFSNDPGMLSFVDQIQNLIASGALTSSGNQISLASLGMDLQSDGTLTFNSSELAVSQSNGLNYNGQQMSLQSILSNGISIGGSAGLSTNLDTTLASITDPGGTIYGDVQIQQSDINYTNTKISFLQNQLNELQNSYTQQYSTLNTLLYNLSQTSSQLTSSLAAVTNINSGK
jgi:flagellar hook-associated protein 2